MNLLVRLTLASGLVALTACAPLKPEPDEEQDRGPDRPVDLSSVPDAEPRHEVRTTAGNRSPYTVLGQTYYLMEDETDYKERGIASWYGKKFHGRRTSNGEVYDMYAMTAAHKKLPIPSYVRVTNLENDKQIVVRVNDRGPFHENRIIDLSYAAAQRLGFADQGVAEVEVEIIVPDDQPPPPLRADGDGFEPGRAELDVDVAEAFLQVGAYGALASAEAEARRLETLIELPVVIHSRTQAPEIHRVRIGPLARDEQARQLREQLRNNGIEQTHIVYE